MDSAIPTDQDLDELKNALEHKRRQAEYSRLKNDLAEATFKAANHPNEFDGQMQLADTEKVLKSKRSGTRFVEVLLTRLQAMLSLRPVIGNIIALLIAGLAMFYIFTQMKAAGFGEYQDYFAIGIQLFAALQIIKSGTRSLILPLLATVIGASIASSLGNHQLFYHFDKAFFQHLMIVGIIGLGIAVLTID